MSRHTYPQQICTQSHEAVTVSGSNQINRDLVKTGVRLGLEFKPRKVGMQHRNSKQNDVPIFLLLLIRGTRFFFVCFYQGSVSIPGFCFGVLVCLSKGQRMSLCFLALLLIPAHLGNSPLFSVFSFFL